MKPLVSVIVPAYNMADYTVKTVESLLGQTYRAVEVIVIDDGSNDNTGEALEPFRDRILFRRQENGGACSARNRGFGISKGNLIAFLDCDDYYHPEKIETFVARFEACPEVGMIYSPEYLVDGGDRIIEVNIPSKPPSGDIFDRLLRNNFIGSSTPMIRREALEKVGAWDESIFTTADWDLWLRVARSFPVGYIARPLSYSRQVSLYNRRNMERTKREAYYVLEKFRREGIPDRLLRVSRSNIDLMLHRYALENGERGSAIRHLIRALRSHPLHPKAWGIVLFSLFFTPLYRALLAWRRQRRLAAWKGLGPRGRPQ